MRAALPVFHPRADARSRAFLWLGVGAVAFTLFAFAQKLVVVPERAARYDALVIAHAAAMMGWLVIYAAQAGLARAALMGWHKALGAAASAVVLAACVTGIWVSREFGAEMGVSHIFLGNLVQLGALAIFYTGGVALAVMHRIAAHRRWMSFAMLVTLTPPISRVTQTLGLHNGVAAVVHVGLLVALPLAWDIAQRRRVHPATWAAWGVMAGLLAAAVTVGLIPATSERIMAFILAA